MKPRSAGEFKRSVPMILELPAFTDDDVQFLARVDRVVRGVAAMYSPEHIQVHRVDNWFGDKWLQFSGKALGALGVWDRSNVVIPPFVPNRITAQSRFTKIRDGIYVYDGTGKQIHRSKPSRDNLVNRVRQTIPETALFWFTGNSKQNGRGAIMGYTPCPPDKYWGWYLGYSVSSEWQLSKQVDFHDNDLTRIDEEAVVLQAVKQP